MWDIFAYLGILFVGLIGLLAIIAGALMWVDHIFRDEP